MSNIELTEAFLAHIAGWQAMKEARMIASSGRVLSSHWAPPLLKGVVQVGETSFRSGLFVKSATDIENICGCRASREWGTLCAHSIAVGLHLLHPPASTPMSPTAPASSILKTPSGKSAHIPKAAVLSRSQPGEPGVPLQLHVILPPNFEQAVVRGKVMLYFEAASPSGRCPLDALPKHPCYSLDSEDARLLDKLEELSGGITPGMLQLPTSLFASLLPSLTGHSRITLGKSQRIQVDKVPFSPPIRATLQPNGEILLEPGGAGMNFTPIDPGWAWIQGSFRPVALSNSLTISFRKAQTIPRSRIPRFLNQEWPALVASGAAVSNFTLDHFQFEPHTPQFILNLSGGLGQLSGQLQCAYGARILTLGVCSNDESLWMPSPDSPTRYSTRDPAAEQAALARLKRSGFSSPDMQGRFQLLGQDRVLSFFARDYPRMEKEWKVNLEEKLDRSTRQNLERIEPQFSISTSGVRWFDMEVTFASAGGERFSAAEIQRLVLSGQNHHRLKNGRIALIDTELVDELHQVLLDCAPEQREGAYRIDQNQAGFLEASLRRNGWQARAPSGWRERSAGQAGETPLPCPPLGPLENVLRPYQKQGVAWMRFLRQHGFGGILADEMGLGKTLQTLTHLSLARHEQSPKTPSLVVCPTSLVFNWAAEAARFVPELRVLVLDGPRRHSRFADIPSSDLVITSYALLRRDADHYRTAEFETVVLDEAQHIKNRQTQNSQAVKAIRCRHRLVLTGTPLENSVSDLWSIFDFLMPGYLGAAQEFKERYEIPITRDKDERAQSRLARRIKPFLLRRLKKEVAADLPDRIDQQLWCDLTPDQAAAYQQVLEASRREVMDAVGAQGLAKSRMVVLTALLRLRQICCDLRLLKLENLDPSACSSKLDLLAEVMDEAIDGGHRMLVFSQFVELLRLVRARLDEQGIQYCYLDGSTSDRGAEVGRFQTQSQIPVFLISLKAGGTGLNLTGADTVIHLDPWWNPAIEDQATGRAHRIGQSRTVTSYKLVTRGTVEEKIVQLQSRKREIFQATLGDEQLLAGTLSWDEIQDLLGSA